MLKQRLATGLVLAAVVLVAFFVPGGGGALFASLLLTVIVAAAAYECTTLSAEAGFAPYPRFAMAFAVAFPIVNSLVAAAGYERSLTAWDAVLFLVALAVGLVMVCRFPRDLQHEFRRLGASLFVILYVGWTLSFLVKLYYLTGFDNTTGRLLTLFFVVVVKMSDVGAYVVGSWTAGRPEGNHKLLPQLSPKKSWEGLAGGMLASVVAALVMTALLHPALQAEGVFLVSWRLAIATGVLSALVGLMGDLGESALKRSAQADDSGNLPGLGGALDVVDSLVLMAPLFYLLVLLIQTYNPS